MDRGLGDLAGQTNYAQRYVNFRRWSGCCQLTPVGPARRKPLFAPPLLRWHPTEREIYL